MDVSEMNAIVEQWEHEQSILDLRTGILCSVILEPYRDHKAKSKPFTPFDFGLPFLKQPKPVKQTPDQMLEVLKAMTIAYGGTIEGL